MTTARRYSDRKACAHAWANSPTSAAGKAGNVFFEGGKLYSYGRHFVIARILPGVNANGERVAVFGLHSYSSSTAQHQSIARAAWGCHIRPTVWAHDPDANAASNKDATERDILVELDKAATARRILQRTRDAHRAHALHLAEQFNAYLAALLEDERGHVTPFDLTDASFAGLLEARAILVAQRAEQAEAEQARKRAQLAEAVAVWRAGGDTRHGLHVLPPMLRLVRGKGLHTGGLLREGKADVIETSHGAEIPARVCPMLWRNIRAVMASGVDKRMVDRVGAYGLNLIRADGSIVVGCHDIAFTEIEGIAREMGLIETATA